MDTTTAADAEQDRKHAEAIAENARRDEIETMRAWLADCGLAGMTADHFARLSDDQVITGVEQYYGGGVDGFVTGTPNL